MAIIFTFGLIAYYWIVLQRYAKNGSILSVLLWWIYLFLGLSGIFLYVTGGIEPIYEPNYLAASLLLIFILISISGFLQFRTQYISQIFGAMHGQRIIEFFLITSQLFAIIFFFPFALGSMVGDVNENRLHLAEKMEILGSYGLLNTVAGAASQLFSSSLVMAFIRLASKQNQGRSILRALLLIFASSSYIIYILAYVGRDGIVFWLMTVGMIFLVFRPHLDPAIKKQIAFFGTFCAIVLLIPFALITISRFYVADQGAGWSFFEYFGAQIHNFSDYSSIDRPTTLGVANFPMFIAGSCVSLGLICPAWLDIKDMIFQQYLDQGKVPWQFGTFASDFVGDFGNVGTLIILMFFSFITANVSSGRGPRHIFSLSRLLLVLFLYLIPFWGVFYFRFAISNGFIIVNFAFFLFVLLLQRITFLFWKNKSGG
jgi:hypothetical protein